MGFSKFLTVFQPNQNSTRNTTEWPDPEPLHSSLTVVMKLPETNIPEAYRGWVLDVARRMQCPPDFIAVAAIVATASIIGAGCGIKPKQHDDWLVVPNLWGGIVGRPGMLKTPAVSEVMRLFNKLESDAKAAHDSAITAYQNELEIYKAEKDAVKNAIMSSHKKELGGDYKKNSLDIQALKDKFRRLKEPSKPIWKRYKTNDATIEKINELLADNPRGLLLYRDELVGLLSTWEKEGRESDRAFFLEAWNGYGSMTTDRITRGTLHAENLCLSIFGNTQPAKLSRYLYKALRGIDNDGLLQRFQLLIYPDMAKTWELVDQPPDRCAKERAQNIFSKLVEMDFTHYGAIKETTDRYPFFRFDENAQEIFNSWLKELEQEKLQQDEAPILIEHLAKYRSLVPSLALIFHLISVADGKDGDKITLDSMVLAYSWSVYLESHARRIYSLVNDIPRQAAERLGQKIQQGALPSPFSLRDIYRKEWGMLHDKDTVRKACDELVDAHWLRQESQSYEFGRPKSFQYLINPKLKIQSNTEENIF